MSDHAHHAGRPAPARGLVGRPAFGHLSQFGRLLARTPADGPPPVADAAAAARRFAGFTFLIRVVNAGIAFVTQILLARWIGAGAFGLYAYVWTWVLLLGAVGSLGLANATQRFIPEYVERSQDDLLRGFLAGSRLLGTGFAVALAGIGLAVLLAWGGALSPGLLVPACLGLACLPAYVLTDVQEGIARSYDWSDLAMWPAYFIRPLLFIAGVAGLHRAGLSQDATGAMAAAAGATWLTAAVQSVRLARRLRTSIPGGPVAYAPRLWLATSLPIFLVDGFFLLLSYSDVIVLERFVPAAEVGLYYAATKLVSLVAFVFFAVASASAHRFTQMHVADRPEELKAFMRASIRWTFLPSLGLSVVIAALGRPLLGLFGPDFEQGEPILAVLLLGLLARASIGPCEKLLNMLGHQRACAGVYALCFAVNLALCCMLIPWNGPIGAAIATSSALGLESVLLASLARRRLGVEVFIWRSRR